ncbi:MAG: hypothetical protein M1818_008103 [Claussenomyces sp. TS43310]|nr:MAG: hypothetical protein M1818_008103 [Claussenomyces sp. TS43310]
MSTKAASTLRRALLYVPSSSTKFLEKSRGLTVDTVCYDLEDSVTPSNKAPARSALSSFLAQPRPSSISETAVRINDVSSGFALDDLQAVLKAENLDTLVVPKVNSAADLHFVTDVIRHALPARHLTSSSSAAAASEDTRPPLKIVALIESARALTDLREICAASPYLDGLIFAAEDFALDLSLSRTPSLSEFLYARSAISTAARAFHLASTIDLVCTSFRGDAGLKTLEEECLGGKGLGFNGKQCIHPSQIEVVQRIFAPEEKEVVWAMRVVIADEKADAMGRGAWTLDGKMIDLPVVGKARAIVSRAERCGADVATVRERWKDQEPE